MDIKISKGVPLIKLLITMGLTGSFKALKRTKPKTTLPKAKRNKGKSIK
jgi:hypothetical protein